MNPTGQHVSPQRRTAGWLNGTSAAALLCLSACGGGGGAAGAGAPIQPNRPPTLSGTPTLVIDTGSRYDFLPGAYDPDGNRLSFTISGKPAWASFDTTTGRLSGTPLPGQVGIYPGIVISVSDGQAVDALPPFQIQVTGTATLTWSPPTQNMDGSGLQDLSGFRVYFGTSAATLVLVDNIPTPTQFRYLLGGLTAGSWYFAVTAYNAAGIESDFSNIEAKTIY